MSALMAFDLVLVVLVIGLVLSRVAGPMMDKRLERLASLRSPSEAEGRLEGSGTPSRHPSLY
jgi:hypothetical protein